MGLMQLLEMGCQAYEKMTRGCKPNDVLLGDEWWMLIRTEERVPDLKIINFTMKIYGVNNANLINT